VTGDEPSGVPFGTEFLSDQGYPGLTVLGNLVRPERAPKGRAERISRSKPMCGDESRHLPGRLKVRLVQISLFLLRFLGHDDDELGGGLAGNHRMCDLIVGQGP
jgi:hypothetical protein